MAKVVADQSMPHVSVVIPAYNSEAYIAEAIQSALDQSYRDLEVIVVDDGSTDGTEKIVRAFPQPVIYYRQENRGAGAARTLGVQRASGEWIAFLDADDVWYPDKLAVQLEEAWRQPSVSFFYSDMDMMDEAGRLIEKDFLQARTERRKKDKEPALDAVAFHNLPFPYPSTVLLKRSLFLQAGGFSKSFPANYHEDFEFFARLAHTEPIHFIPRSLVRYRLSFSETKEQFRDANWPILLSHLWQMWSGTPEKQAFLLPYYSHYFSKRGKSLLRSGKYREAREHFRISFRFRPFYWRNLRRWGASYFPSVRRRRDRVLGQ
jgi:glycosyltransferase involved in cell wall biosynthesis